MAAARTIWVNAVGYEVQALQLLSKAFTLYGQVVTSESPECSLLLMLQEEAEVEELCRSAG